jgi:murein L,D-transpeptidase YafK
MAVALWVAGISCAAVANDGVHPDGLPPRVRVDRLVVYKGDRRMEAYAGETLLRSYRVAVGSGGVGDKRYEGDLHTPEGTYRIDSRHHSRQYHRFLHVSYPNREDRRRYRAARAAGDIPEGRGIGGDIGIHGTPAVPGLSMFDWTAGCIALTDDEAEELYRAVRDDAVIEIHP